MSNKTTLLVVTMFSIFIFLFVFLLRYNLRFQHYIMGSNTPLIVYVAFYKSDDELNKVLSDGVSDINESYGIWNALLFSCDIGYVEKVKMLLQHGANPNVVINDNTPLLSATNPKVINLLIRYGADIDYRDKYGFSIMDNALRQRHYYKAIIIFLSKIKRLIGISNDKLSY